jgi:hypothetical protein
MCDTHVRNVAETLAHYALFSDAIMRGKIHLCGFRMPFLLVFQPLHLFRSEGRDERGETHG